MKTVYFVRHGESEVNRGGIGRGEATLLTEVGRSQALFVAERVAKLPFDVLVSSPMERAKATAQAIAERMDMPAEYSDLFVEGRKPSWFIGRPQNDPEVIAADREIIKNFTTPGHRFSDEENFDDLKKRALAALGYLKNRKEEGIVVVTHGLFTRVLLAAVIYGDKLSAHECGSILGGALTENTGISIIKEDDKWISGWKLFVFNDHAHLAE